LKNTKDNPDSDNEAKDSIQTTYDPETTHDLWEESDQLDEETLKKFTEKYIDASQKGLLPNYLESMIATLKDGDNELPWHWYLKKLLGSVACEQKKTTARRNRRQPERLDLPGRLRNHKAKIYIAIDISGSISDNEFKQAMQEVFRIVKSYNHEITIIECDNEIRRMYAVQSNRDLKERLNVRGGTEYTPVFDYANGQKIDLLVYFTDGKGEEELRTKPKGYKTLWVISGEGEKLSLKEPYGIVKNLSAVKVEDTTLDSYDVEKGGFSMNHQEDSSLDI
jgi:predicted metal-dependent peptidase